MNLYFAPMEGVTTYTYRTVHNRIFGGCTAYFAPFITPSDNERVSIKSLRDVMPDKNKNFNLKVQVLTCQADAFLRFAERVKELGYDEINLNLGCPSSTVVKKGRGAAFLADPEGLIHFFEEVFSKTNIKVSVKTRIGFSSKKELSRLMEIFNSFPIDSLTIHPRTREDYYKGIPDMSSFEEAYRCSKNQVCYNGNVYSPADFTDICERFPNIEGVMIGRGALKNPAIFREIRGGKPLSTEELIQFSNELETAYLPVLGSEVYTIHKLKEIWLHIMLNFPEEKKILKAIKKANKLSELQNAVCCLSQL